MAKKRLSIPMDQKTFETLQRLAEVSNSSLGATAGAYLDGIEPQLSKIADATELLKTNPDKAVKLLLKAGFDAQATLTEEQLQILNL